MIDYEQPLPPAIERAYANAAGPYLERGSPIMLGATHIARQMLWLEQELPGQPSPEPATSSASRNTGHGA